MTIFPGMNAIRSVFKRARDLALLAAGALAVSAAVAPAVSAQTPIFAQPSVAKSGGGLIYPGDTVIYAFTLADFNANYDFADLGFTIDFSDTYAGIELEASGVVLSCGGSSAITAGPTLVVYDASATGFCSVQITFTLPDDITAGSHTIVSTNLTGTLIDANTFEETPLDVALNDPSFTVNTDTAGPIPDVYVTSDFKANEPFEVTISWDEPVVGFDAGDVSVAGGSLSGFQAQSSGDGGSSATLFRATVTPDGAGTVTISVASGAAEDELGNVSTTGDSETVTITIPATLDLTIVENPADPGDVVTFRFTLTNNHDSQSLSAGTFFMDLNLALSTTAAQSVPSTPCGASSAITPASANRRVTLSNAELGPLGTCSFDIPVVIPAGATPGFYSFPVTNVSYQLGGTPITGDSVADILQLNGVEGAGAALVFEKNIVGTSSVLPGDTLTVEYLLVPEEGTDATALAFTDDFDAVISGMVAVAPLPSEPCGTGSALSGTSTLSLTGGNLADGEQCRFEVTLQVPAGAASGNYLSTTGTLTGSQDGDSGPEAISEPGVTAGFSIVATVPGATIEGPTASVGVGVPFTVTVRFSEPVSGLEDGDFNVTNGTLSGVSGDGSTFTASVTAAGAGTVEISLPADSVVDTDSNGNTVSNTLTVTAVAAVPEINVTGRDVDIASGAPLATVTDGTYFGQVDATAGTLTRTFVIENSGTGPLTLSGATPVTISGADAADFTVVSQPSSPVAAGSSESFQIEYDPSAAAVSDATVSIASDDADENPYTFAIQGEGIAAPEIALTGNGNAISTGDVTPSATDHTDFGSIDLGNSQTRTFTIENVGGATLTLGANAVSIDQSGSEYAVTTQPATTVAASGNTTFQITYTPAAVGSSQVIVNIANDDANENPYTFAIVGTGTGGVEVNLTGQSVDIAAGDLVPATADGTDFGSVNVGATVQRTFVIENTGTIALDLFPAPSERGGTPGTTTVDVFGSSDFTVSSQPAASVGAGGTSSFTISYTPTSAGTVAATTIAFGTSDGDEARYEFAVTGFATQPEIAVEGEGNAIASGDTTPSATDGTLFASLNEDSGSDAQTFTINNTGDGVLTLGSDAVSVSGTNAADFTVTTQPATTVAASGNTTFVVTFDPSGTGARTATISIANDDADEAPYTFSVEGEGLDITPPAAFTADFDAPTYGVAGASAASFTFDGAEVGTTYAYTIVSDGGAGSVSDSGTVSAVDEQVSSIDVSGLPDGTLTLSVTLTDASTNSTGPVTDTADLDTVVPTLVISGPTDTQTGAFTATFTFSEDVTDFALADISVGNGSASLLSGSGDTYTATITPDADGTVTVDVAADGAIDGARNGNAAATQFSVEADVTAPTLVISGPTATQTGAFTATFTFSEDVTGFTLAEISVGNGSASALSGSGDTYTATITPDADGTVTVDVAADVADDDAGNGNEAATQFSVEADVTAPTLVISGPTATQTGAFTATFTFSEDVTGFALANISVGNGSASALSGSGDTYTATITPSADGTVTVDVAADAADDDAGNGNEAATQFSVEADVTAPTLVISGPTAAQTGAFTATFTFSEDVTGFALANISVGNGSASALSGSGDTYTATITPAADGTVTVDVAADVADDAAGNGNDAATQFSVEADVTAPTLVISGPTSTQTGAFTATFTFSEDVTGFALANISVGNGSASALSGSGDTYTATITPSSDGTVTVDVAADAADDAAGNGSEAATQFSVEADVTAPTLVISGPTATQTGAFTATFTFSEDVSGFALGNISVGNGSASALSGSGDTYTATITPSADGTVTVDVAADAADDAAGNGNEAATQFSVEADVTAPTLVISGPTATQTGAFTATFTFSEDVTGFALANISVGNGSASGLSGSGDTYTATITPSSDGTVTVDVAADVADDAAGNGSEAATQFSVEADITDPTLVIGGPTATQTGAFTATFTFSEDVTGFALANISVGNGSASALSGSGDTYTATITPSADGTVTVDVAADAVDDAAGNGNAAASQFSVEADVTAPTLVISGPTATQTGAFTATFTFSEDVTGFALANISVGNGAASGLSGSGDTYTATITPSADGTVTVDVAADAADDAAGNGNTAATQFSVEADVTVPTLVISGPTATQTGAFTAAFTFSEDVTGFTLAEISVGNGSASALSGSGDTYTATITPDADGTVTVDVAADVAADAAGNGNTAATQFSVEADVTAPTLVISGPTATQTGAFTATFTFSEDVTGFALANISVGNGSASALSGSGDTYTATITPSADGTVTVDVAADAADDAAGNGNEVATQFSVEADVTAPTLVVSGPTATQTGAFTATFTFSEDVTGFALANISVGNGSASALSGSGDTYTATITPAADGTVTVDVAADVADDAAGNGNEAATQFSVEADVTAPTLVISGPTAAQTGAFTATFTFSEDVTGFALADISVGNGAASGLSGSGDTYTATITPDADGTVTVDVAADAADDAAGNGNIVATQFAVGADITVPTLVISGPTAAQTGAFTATFTFSEDVTGFALADISVGNGSASALAGSGDTYTATITPAADGTVTVDVAADAADDAAGNGNIAATQFSVGSDITLPTLAISGPTATQTGAFTATFTFSEDVSGFAVADISVGNGSASGLSGSGDTYTATITPSADGTVTVDVATDVASDAAGNGNTAATQFSVEADITVPTLVISGPTAAQTGAFTATFTFSEDVTGFALADISVGNGAASGLSGSGDTYTATITPAADGAVTVDVAADVAADAAGNGNTAATQFSVGADITLPTLEITGPAATQIAPFTATFTFSEDVTGFAVADITVGNGAASDLSGSGDTYTATITPAASGTVTVDVAADVANDAAGNGNTVATQFTLEADLNLPSVQNVVASDIDVRVEDIGDSFTLTVSFSEAMDISVEPVLTFSEDVSAVLAFQSGAFSDGDTVYTATYSITDGSVQAVNVGVTVAAAQDAAGNVVTTTIIPDVFGVETRRGSIEIAELIDGAVDGAFDFTGDLGDFSITTTGQAGSQSFTDLTEGSYSVTVSDPDGFSLTAINCSGGTTSVDMPTRSVTITLSPADAVTCTFDTLADPTIDEDSIPEVEIELPTSIEDPTSQTVSFSLDNTGGEAFYFTAATDVAWLTIDPTSGSIPAEGSLEFTVSFTEAVLDLEPGTYNAVITITETTGTAANKDYAHAGALSTVEIPVTITLEPREGNLTIITTTAPAEAGDGDFTYASSLAELDGLALSTSNGTATSSTLTVLRGSYDLTQNLSEGWALDSISCTGDNDGGNVVDLENGTITIDLDAQEEMVCTFANRRDEAFIRQITQSAIRSFMATRADQILTNSPRLATRMRSDRTGATPNNFAADYRDGRFNAEISTSLSAIRQAVESNQPQAPGADRFSLLGRTGMSSLDVWMQASYSSIEDNRAGLDSSTDFGIYYLGVDAMATENVLVGMLMQYDQAETTTGEWRSHVEGDGWMIGPYMVARLNETAFFDIRAAWGQSDNEVNPIGTYTDSFETDRWLIEANLTGDIIRGGWRLSPEIGVAYFSEEQASYTDTLGFFIPSQSITIGRINAGPEIAYRFRMDEGGYIEPYLQLTAAYDYDDAEVFNATGQLQSLGALRGDARLGLIAELANGGRLTGEVSIQGLGEGNFEANSAMIRIRLPLSME